MAALCSAVGGHITFIINLWDSLVYKVGFIHIFIVPRSSCVFWTSFCIFTVDICKHSWSLLVKLLSDSITRIEPVLGSASCKCLFQYCPCSWIFYLTLRLFLQKVRRRRVKRWTWPIYYIKLLEMTVILFACMFVGFIMVLLNKYAWVLCWMCNLLK